MALVFQYGSNCSSARLNSEERLQGDAVIIGWAETIDNYELKFDVWSTKNNCAAANIVPGGDTRVQGVLYEIPDDLLDRNTAPRGRKSLDAIEGKNYARKSIRVRKRDGDTVVAQTYVVTQPKDDLLTSAEYVNYIISGLREHGADEAYIDKVKNIAARNHPMIAKEVSAL
jgi:gamma-glutamylcyclotransferase (GGCT)/AIG2-like uncharacterized protein YtfP